MRLFYLIFYLIAFTIGGCFAFRHNIQFPHRTPKNLKTVQQKPMASSARNYLKNPVEPKNKIYLEGEKLFRVNCANCHNKNMISDMTGPALLGVEERWATFPPEDLYRWVKNSQAMVEEGHPRAVELWNTWNKSAMLPFPDLEDKQIRAIFHYIKYFDK